MKVLEKKSCVTGKFKVVKEIHKFVSNFKKII